MPIRELPPHLVNQIAAGEVVERPASVLKELLENSLDAGARRIEVDLAAGGISLCRVRDDGTGIPVDELALSLARHATSKIGTLDDLECVATLGFRGEALPSIASVSRLRLSSRARGSTDAFSIQSDDGVLGGPVPAPHPEGTSVEVRDLFYNTPARRRFLRSERTELSHARTVVERIALSRPGLAIVLRHNGRTLLDMQPAGTPAEHVARVGQMLGSGFVAEALYLEHESNGLLLRGWVARPGFAGGQPDRQHFYVNGRAVRDRLLASAVRAAYRDVLYRGRQPAYVLHLEMDPAAVDVNAHPAKHEVRFRNPGPLHDFVRRTVETALAGPADAVTAAGVGHVGATALPVNGGGLRPPQLAELPPAYATPARLPLESGATAAVSAAVAGAVAAAGGDPGQPGEEPPALGHAIAQLHGVYILAQNERGLVVVDAHAAHERVTYERLKRQLRAGLVPSQALLVPVAGDCTAAEADLAEAAGDVLERTGFGLRRSAPGRVSLTAVPAVLAGSDLPGLLRSLLRQLREGMVEDDALALVDAVLANLACRASVRAHRPLDLHEMNRLLRDMEATPRSGHCSHGRRTWQQFDLRELDRLFDRGR